MDKKKIEIDQVKPLRLVCLCVSLVLTVLLIAQPVYAGPRCDFRESLSKANGAIFKESHYQSALGNFHSVFVVPSDIPNALRGDILEWKPNGNTTKCRWNGAGKTKKKSNFTSTGRANGNRENLRSPKNISELPNKCLLLRIMYDLGTDGRVKHCFSINSVDPVRNE